MNSIFGFFLLSCVLATGFVIYSPSLLFSSDDLVSFFTLSTTVFAEEQVNATLYNDTNSTSITLNDTVNVGDNMIVPDDTNSTSITLNDTVNVGDNMIVPDDNMHTDANMMTPEDVLSPLKQIKNGIMTKDVVCKQDLKLTFRIDGQAACVKITSIEKLITRGWTQ